MRLSRYRFGRRRKGAFVTFIAYSPDKLIFLTVKQLNYENNKIKQFLS